MSSILVLSATSSRWTSWGIVQVYYATYHVTQALIVASGETRPIIHPKTQGQFTSLWVKRKILLPPWTFGYGHGGVSNVDPTITVDPNIHGWSRCDCSNAWSIAAMALRTSRVEKVTEDLKAKRFEMQRSNKKLWQIEEDLRVAAGKKVRKPPASTLPLLSQADKEAVNKSVWDYTVMDYLYRLRIRANYEDAALFTDGPEMDIESSMLHRHVTYLVAATNLVTDFRIRQLVGNSQFTKWMVSFIKDNVPSKISVGIAARRDLLATRS